MKVKDRVKLGSHLGPDQKIFWSLGLGLGPDPRTKPKTHRDPSQNVCQLASFFLLWELFSACEKWAIGDSFKKI